MRPPWILVLCHEFPPLGGGAGKNLYLLCRELARRGMAIEVWTSDPGEGKRWRPGFEIAYIPAPPRGRFETSFIGMAAFLAGACRMGWGNRRERPALVLANLAIPAGLAGAFLASLLRAPLAVWHHGSDVHAGRRRGPGPIQRLLLRRVWRTSRVNFFVAPGLLEMARALGSGRPRILPACPSPEILARSGEAPAAAGYFLFLGRFDAVKNPLLILSALRLLEKEGGAMRPMRMVGSGALSGSIRAGIRRGALAHRVSVEDAAEYADVPDLLRSAYALVVPSRIEGFNTTILEAARFGVPAVASDAQGLRDFVRHGETGLLFPENDAAGLARALEGLSANPALRDALGRKARMAAEAYRPERVAEAFLSGIAEPAPALGAWTEGAAAWN